MVSDHYDRYNGMEKLLSTNLAEVGTEAISKQQAIDAVNCVTVMKGIRSGKSVTAEAVDCAKRIIADNIRQLPPIQPKRGKWENISNGIEYDWGTCDKCKARIPMAYKYYEFCPHCGVKMDEVTT